MNVLIVAEQKEIGEYLEKAADPSRFTFIQYQHALKALDNMNEIRPDFIFWSHDDYPRHWKIAFYLCKRDPQLADARLFLVSETELSEEEKEKASSLGVEETLDGGFFSEKILKVLSSLSKGETSDAKETSVLSGNGVLGFTSPTGKSVVLGKVIRIDRHLLEADFSEQDSAGARSLDIQPNEFIDQAFVNVTSGFYELSLKCLKIREGQKIDFVILGSS